MHVMTLQCTNHGTILYSNDDSGMTQERLWITSAKRLWSFGVTPVHSNQIFLLLITCVSVCFIRGEFVLLWSFVEFMVFLILMAPNKNKVCAISDCYNDTPDIEKQYHRFPKNPRIRNIWVRRCKRTDLNPDSATICSLHFSACQRKHDLKYNLSNNPPPKNYRCLIRSAVPDINLPSRVTPSNSANDASLLTLLQRKKCFSPFVNG